MDELLRAVGSYGFPAVVAAYLLVRMENKLDQLARCIKELREAIIALNLK
ncbi:MAG: YvrJ family protein [Syntrophomonadaceae bacterium]|nr:YvrJ family protein [Syntrophomonadaceae bacterium]